MKTRTLVIRGTEHRTAHEALEELNFSGDHAVSLGGRYFTIDAAEMARLQGLGVQPTTWHDVRGRILSVPGNVD